jgi:hypothetical protein
MELNVLTGFVTRECVTFSWAFGSASPSGEQTRVRIRAMTMGLIYFFIFIAASGAIIYWYGHRSVLARKGSRASVDRRRKNNMPDEPLLALRRNAIRNTIPDPDHDEFLERVDVWKKEHQVRRDWFNQNAESIHGTKYTYTPPGKRSSAAESSG